MTYIEFQKFRQDILTKQPTLKDAAETNLYRALQALAPAPTDYSHSKVHRCHLASQWIEYYHLPASISRRAIITSGVRDSLETLFHYFATVGSCIWIPEDNYPVYHEIAERAGASTHSFCTLPEPQWPTLAPPADNGEILLVTNPLKPRNRWLDAADISSLREWLAVTPRRRLILDMVYLLDASLPSAVSDLLSSDQVIVLHSLTKGWLHPRLFGIALVPEQDASALTPVFRDRPPTQASLERARHLLTHHAELPRQIAASLCDARVRLREAMPEIFAESYPTDSEGYFFPMALPWEELLKQGVLGLPASIFGSSHPNLTFLSSLAFVPCSS